ncbi:hypothetical protein CAC42_7069 [Sphaceloma murrayae]|uniref:TEA domain-containing protein n=1 Tax=Sphaceloma murrayae TaxID=2082308 RepID=A0A2K1QQL3_9PEZI|nr:hypothetical protein CAC42_7069 [Sphaceloma murrayae]
MTQLYETAVHLPRVPVVPSSGHDPANYGASSASSSYDESLHENDSQPFHGQALMDFAHRSSQIYGVKEQICLPIVDLRTKKLVIPTRAHNDELKAQANNLFREFLGCPGFLNYRTRRKKNKKDAVWPDFVEYAFFEALVRYPPCGRTTFSSPYIKGGKPMGTNELRGHHIHVATGLARDRKQISSHLQVIRPYVRDKPRLLAWLISTKGKPAGMSLLRRISPHVEPITQSLAEYGPQMSGLKLATCSSQAWTLCEFDMSLCPLLNQSEKKHDLPLHTYSRSNHTSRLPDIQIEEFRLAFVLFPELFQNHLPRPIGTTILAVEASISLPELLKFTNASPDLVIHLILRGPSVPSEAEVETVTTIFSPSSPPTCNTSRLGSRTPHPCPSPTESYYQIPFFSAYWADLLSSLGRKYSTAPKPGPVPSDPTAQLDASLRSITALQQITVRSRQNPDIEHRVALRWQFRLSGNSGTGSSGGLHWRAAGIPRIEMDLPSPLLESRVERKERGKGSGPSTPMSPGDVGGLRSPIALKGEWDGFAQGGKGADESRSGPEGFGVGLGGEGEDGERGMFHVGFLPEDLGMASVGVEGGFDFADFAYGEAQDMTVVEQGVMDPSLVGEGWGLVGPGQGLGLDLLRREGERGFGYGEMLQIDPWMTGGATGGVVTHGE